MRIDKYLKNARLIKRRTVAKEACDAGRITINGKTVKAGASVNEGDIITITFGNRITKVQVLRLLETVKKEEGPSMYQVLESQ